MIAMAADACYDPTAAANLPGGVQGATTSATIREKTVETATDFRQQLDERL